MDCPICLLPFTPNQLPYRTSNCLHSAHLNCLINYWFHASEKSNARCPSGVCPSKIGATQKFMKNDAVIPYVIENHALTAQCETHMSTIKDLNIKCDKLTEISKKVETPKSLEQLEDERDDLAYKISRQSKKIKKAKRELANFQTKFEHILRDDHKPKMSADDIDKLKHMEWAKTHIVEYAEYE
jgi:predicted RNase H-like nuclease (RuvC/YqgF family)